MDLLSDQGIRMDGRRPNELRKIECKLGVSTGADGSAYVEHGHSKVLVSVYGPHDVSFGNQIVINTNLASLRLLHFSYV